MESPREPAATRAVDLELRGRLLFAIPMATALIALVAAGGAAFAIAIALIAALATVELARMLELPPKTQRLLAATAAASVVLTHLVGVAGLGASMAIAIAVAFGAAVASAAPTARAPTASFALLAIVWIGGTLAHGVLLRELPHGGALVTMAVLATFVGDTGAHLIGARFGRRPLAATISPNKTVEGLAAGIVIGTASVLVFAVGWHGSWLEVHWALGIGLVASLAAPAGDLCESMVKRSVGVKESGRILGPHGGVLDRIDAVMFSAVATYYLASLLV